MLIKYQLPDCLKFDCNDACCRCGVDVWPHELDNLVNAGVATKADFTGPYRDDENDWLYRTAIGPRGCIFLKDDRGCRWHGTELKPITCIETPRDDQDVEVMIKDGMMPCCGS